MSDLVDEPSESEVVISRRGRGRPRYIRTGKPGRPRKEYPTANLSTQELLEAKYLPDPKDAEEALSGRDSYFWKKAMEEEFDSLIKNKTWELVDPPKNRNIIGTKWVFKTKCNSDGSVERHKARLVAKGYSQQYGIDYEETFAPVVRQSTIRMFLALAVEYNLILHQMDVQSAYLNGEIKEEIYMTQPENFVSRKYPERHDEGILLVAIYVDDLIIAAEREDTLKSFKESMKRIFKIKDLGGINCCLGIRIQIKEDGSISIDQERYIEELLAKYRMKEAKPISTPMDSNSKLTKVSSIEVSTRPDIAYAVSALGQFSNDPRRQHWNAAKRVLRYLKGTSCLRITYRKSNEALHGYVDADWGGNLVDRKSHTGIVYFLARGPIAWESKKQQTVTLSSTESEYIALCEAGKEAVYLRALLDEMGFGELLNGPTVLKTDNQGAQQLARNPVYHARTKHIDIKWHFIRSICSDGLVEVVHTPTQENVADILTKGLPRFGTGYPTKRQGSQAHPFPHENRATNARKLYEEHLAGSRSEYTATLDEAWMYVTYCNGIRKICYIKRGNQVPDNWVHQCSETFPKGFMVVGVMTGRGVLPLIKVPSKVKVNSEFYIECVLKPVIEQLKDLYPGEMDKVFLHHDKASSHTSNKTQQFLQEMKDTLGLNFIRNSDIPVKSPDASPLDFYGFGMLKQRLFNRRPKTVAGLWKAAQEEWSNVSLSKVKEVFAAWKVRCREIAKKKGKHIEHMKKIHVRKIKF
ncbi:hypothetical protein LAZ67_5002157 [Cordylochernes scorpioides]|uniref:Reverse transcriptase Ty1/copia-type domain-containing protein n=1 Tax=Cordylochernes scorpioides TaxID=51811 RepID=A0ABY6KG40_9ARAC|nr:hypothetical protein LAZ67_5002157 [Cordylochernes scorpioides]